jgi:hypothetical protein
VLYLFACSVPFPVRTELRSKSRKSPQPPDIIRKTTLKQGFAVPIL